MHFKMQSLPGISIMALNNFALLETYLKDIIFNEEQILTKVEMREHIFEIKDSVKTLGFIPLYDLKAYVYEHEEEAENYLIRNIDNSEWKNIFEHPYFQRRKPQIVANLEIQNIDDLEFFILKNGQKSGPFEKNTLLEMVRDKNILLTDMVSFNAGLNWNKLYQIEGFDRRSKKGNEQLPGTPSNEVLSKPSDTVKNISQTTDAISSLAFLGNQKKGKTLEHQREVSYQDEMNKNARSSSIYKWLLIASVFGIIYFLLNIKFQLGSPFQADTTGSVGEQFDKVQVQSENLQFDNSSNFPKNNEINNQKREGKFESRRLEPIRPVSRKSFMDTNKYKEATESPQLTPEDGNYFYDNNNPMELDPVRAQISKENFDDGGEPGPAPEADPLFPNETTN